MVLQKEIKIGYTIQTKINSVCRGEEDKEKNCMGQGRISCWKKPQIHMQGDTAEE